MKKVLILSVILGSIASPTVAQLYDCNGDAACESKRATVTKSSYNKRIVGCLAAQGHTIEQWRARAVPTPAAIKVRACVSR
jgi:hypothetical protein